MLKKDLSKEKITKSTKRVKNNGEVYTPKKLVDEILDKLPTELWMDKNKMFLDPACGNGNFLVEVYKRKVKSGSTKWEALSTVFGVDIMPDNVLECQQRLLQEANVKQKRFVELISTTIVVGDTLKQDANDLFSEHVKKYKHLAE